MRINKRFIAYAAVVIVAAFLVGRSQQQAEQLSVTVKKVAGLTAANHGLVTSLQAAIVNSCRENGNQRARVQRESLEEEITKAEHPDPEVVAAFDLPPEKVAELVAENVATLKIRLNRIHLTPCREQYSISPGAGQRRADR